jgi:hypothetical protein
MNLIKKATAFFKGEDTLRLVSDQPTAKDTIGIHSQVADTVIEVVCSSLERPFVIGLFGSWG